MAKTETKSEPMVMGKKLSELKPLKQGCMHGFRVEHANQPAVCSHCGGERGAGEVAR